jgi:hypothetical protein
MHFAQGLRVASSYAAHGHIFGSQAARRCKVIAKMCSAMILLFSLAGCRGDGRAPGAFGSNGDTFPPD